MFNALLIELCQRLDLPESCLHKQGLDLNLDSFSLHIREKDQLVTLLIPLCDQPPRPLSELRDWPSLHMSCDEDNQTLLWSREWLERLDVEILASLIERMIRQAHELTLDAR
ncbi:MAG: hypothetical protein RL571_3511 [Pseudomonadota bacterium]|jgi:hypothetical protein